VILSINKKREMRNVLDNLKPMRHILSVDGNTLSHSLSVDGDDSNGPYYRTIENERVSYDTV
jgi:hypothetical protein